MELPAPINNRRRGGSNRISIFQDGRRGTLAAPHQGDFTSHAEGIAQGKARRRQPASRVRSAHDAGMAARRGRPDRDRQAGRSGPRSHRPAEAHGWRLPGAVQQRQGQAQSPRAHQPVRRHQRHQQDVRLEGRCRAREEARLCAQPSAQAGRDSAGRGAVPGARRSRIRRTSTSTWCRSVTPPTSPS